MPLPIFMQKGLTALLQVVKFTDPAALNQAATTLEQHFTLSTSEIAAAYQISYESALKAIIAGLGEASLLNAKVIKEFAEQVNSNYLPAFAAKLNLQGAALSAFCTETIKQCQTLSGSKDLLFSGDKGTLNQQELAALISDNEALSITELVLTELSHQQPLDESLRAFLRYNDLLGSAILFFLEEELRKNKRFQATLSALQTQGLRQDNREIKDLLKQVMNQADLSPQIKPRDEFSHHNSESHRLIENALTKLKQLPANNPQYCQLKINCASVLSSVGALAEAEKSLIEASEIAKTDADRGLAAFNLFQIRLRNGDFDKALTDLQMAIQIDLHRYALHDIDKYPIERILGAGGMGVVFLCRHQLQKQLQVVKCFWESRQGRAKKVFEEAFTMSDIAGEFVPKPIDYGYVDPIKQERAFFVTEYIDGAMDGETWLAQEKPLNLTEGLQVGLQIARSLQVAHEKSILHLDLKPANILLKRSQTGIVVKIIDFGLAKVATSLRQEAVKQQSSQKQLSVLGKNIFGTLDYACPEQQGIEEYGQPSVQCDVFAFGKTLYRLLSGKHPRHNLRQRDLPNVPALYELLEDCVEEEPQNRPKSAQELIERLNEIENSLEITPQIEDEKLKNATNDIQKQLQAMLEQKKQAEREAEAEKKRQEQLQAQLNKEDKQAWELACKVHSIEAYQVYLNGNTVKLFANEAKNRIDKQAWKLAYKVHSIEAYQVYLKANTRQEFANEAKKRIDQKTWESAKKVDSIEAYQVYLNGNTLKQFANEAKKKLQILKAAKNIKQLSALNLLDYLRLLWWGLITPAKVIAYENKFEYNTSIFICLFVIFTQLPLLTLGLALGLEWIFNPEDTLLQGIYLWVSIVIAGLISIGLISGLYNLHGDRDLLPLLISHIVVMVIVVMVIGMDVWNFYYTDILKYSYVWVADPISNMAGTVVGVIAGLIAAAVVVILTFIFLMIIFLVLMSLLIGVAEVSNIPINNITSSCLLAKLFSILIFLLLIAYNIFLVYYCFFDGWKLFV
jgi:serine/threonine protein kinase